MAFGDARERAAVFGELAGGEREPGDEADVLAVAVIEDVFPFAVREVVAVLDGDDVEELARAFDLLDRHFRQSRVQNFSFALELADYAELILFRNIRIDAVQLPEIDSFDAQAAQAAF